MRRSTWLVAMASDAGDARGAVGVALAQNSQQEKMTSCNADAKAKGLKGDDRKSFMKSCLSDKAPPRRPRRATASRRR